MTIPADVLRHSCNISASHSRVEVPPTGTVRLRPPALSDTLQCKVFPKLSRPPRTKPAPQLVGKSRERLRTQMFKGVAELAFLSLVDEAPEYGLKILEDLREKAGLEIAEGTLYPLLYRLEKQGSIRSEWRLLEDASHPRKYYAISAQGKAELKAYLDDWRNMTAQFTRFLNRGKK
jgi:PadR family transcriptional regulator PadR